MRSDRIPGEHVLRATEIRHRCPDCRASRGFFATPPALSIEVSLSCAMIMEPQESAPPQLTLEGTLATIEFRRPGQANRVGPGDRDVLHQHLEDVERDGALRVLVFRGRGKHFSAGYTIQKLAGGEGTSGGGGARQGVGDPGEGPRVVTIAALTGGVYGGSTDLA